MNIIYFIGEVDFFKVCVFIVGGKDIRGWYDIFLDCICLYLFKVCGKEDIECILLYEGVGYYGLCRLVGWKYMDVFLDDIFVGCGEKVCGEIIWLVGMGKMDICIVMEEYLVCMVESGVDVCVWDKICFVFRNFLWKLGFSIEVDDRELKGLFVVSWENLKRMVVICILEKI